MGNAAYTSEYEKQCNESLTLFVNENFTAKREVYIFDYTIYINDYCGKVGEYDLHGSECRMTNDAGKEIAKWHSFDNRSDFYRPIKHSNGNLYLVFRQDLYGYSVLDISSHNILRYFPEKNMELYGETFIWTEIEYNSENDILAVSGCFWACPYSVHLFTFKDPMDDNQRFIDLYECIKSASVLYQDIDFIKWDGRDLHISCLNVISDKEYYEEKIIKENEYLEWFAKKGSVF